MAIERIMRWNGWINSWITHKFNLEIDNSNITSDAVLLSPGSAVADSSASERTIVDDLAMSLDVSFKIMVPLMGDSVACPVCEKRDVHLSFMMLGDLDKHLSLHHVDARNRWECIHCGRSFPKPHGTSCHILPWRTGRWSGNRLLLVTVRCGVAYMLSEGEVLFLWLLLWLGD